MPTVSAHVAHALAAHLRAVFGVMGNGNARFLDVLVRQTQAEFVPVRHEAAAVAAADAFHRAGGSIAAATATYGAGFSNTLTALAEAVQARTPLVLVVGDEPTSGPRPWDVDQIALAAAVGARTYTVGRTDAAATTVIALEHALTYRVPTVLAIPYDVAAAEAGPLGQPPALALPAPLEPSAFARAQLEEVARALTNARRPLLLAGRGAHLAGAGEALGALADAVGALTGTSALARGLFPRAEYDLGVVGGFGAPGAMDLIRTTDVAVVFGASLNQFTMRFGDLFAPGTRVVQVDTAAAATHPHVGTFIRADAAVAARTLVEQTRLFRAATPRAGDGEPSWRGDHDLVALRAQEAGDAVVSDGRLDPRAVATRLADLLPPDRVVVSDGGHFIGWANMYWPVASPERMVMVGTHFQAIGLGWGSVAGAQLAQPGATVVLTTGDGGGLMALADLETAVRVAGGNGMAVVWNDAAYGAEVNVYGALGLAREPMLIPEVDFAALARSVGAHGVTVRTLADLDALATWRELPAGERPFLVLDVQVSRDVVAPYQREILARAH